MPREVVESPSTEILKNPVNTVPGNPLYVTMLEQEAGLSGVQRHLPTYVTL